MYHPYHYTSSAAASRILRVFIAAIMFLALGFFTKHNVLAEDPFPWGTKLELTLPTNSDLYNWMSTSESLPSWAAWAEGKYTKAEVYPYYNCIVNGYIHNPLWSPDGKWIAFTDGGKHISLVSAAGGEPRMIWDGWDKTIKDENYNIIGGCSEVWKVLSFSPDGKEVVFVKQVIDLSRGTIVERNQTENNYFTVFISCTVPVIASVDIETGAERTLVDPGLDGRWSHDGKYFVYTKWIQGDWKTGTGYNVPRYTGATIAWLPKVGAGIAVKDMETGKEWVLTEREAVLPVFSPDDTHVLCSIKDESGIYQIYSIPRAGGAPVQLTFYGPDDDGRNALLSDISPDGEWILHGSQFLTGEGLKFGFSVFNTITGKTFQAFPNAEKSAMEGSWSPDGKKFVFTTAGIFEKSTITAKPEIYTIDFQPEPFWKVTGVSEDQPAAFALLGNYPNPFNPSTTIQFSLKTTGKVNLSVYTAAGQKIRELVSDAAMNPGVFRVAWDGRDDLGRPVSSGVYLTRLQMGSQVLAGRMALMK